MELPVHHGVVEDRPTLAAGNATVIKPASFTSVTALDAGEGVQEADIPPGVVNIIAGPGGTRR